jgi:hypothetical protein
MEQVWELARRQYGVVASRQAPLCGVDVRRLRTMVEGGSLLVAKRGVYVAAASVPTWRRDVMVHVLAAGPNAAASLWTSAALLGVPGFPPGRITVTRPWKASRKSLPTWLHESTYLPDHHITTIERIPCIRIDRTYFDLCGVLWPDRAMAVLKSGLSRGLTSYGRLEKVFFETASRGRKGSATMRSFLDNHDGKKVTESELEDMVEAVLLSGGITGFRRQVDLGNGERFIGRRDWKHEQAPVVIEAHSAEFHTDWAVQVGDYCKSLESTAIGVHTIPVTFRILVEQPKLFLAAVRAELATFLPRYREKGGEFGKDR